MSKIYEVLKNVDFDKIAEVVDTEVKEAYLYSIGSNLSGWHKSLLLNEDGSVTLTGNLSCGSMTMDQYEGNSITLYNLASARYTDYDIVQSDNINSLSDENKKKLYDYLYDLYHDYDEEEAEELWDLINDNDLNLDTIVNAALPEVYEELRLENNELQWDVARENIIDQIYETIEQHISHYEYELKYNR